MPGPTDVAQPLDSSGFVKARSLRRSGLVTTGVSLVLACLWWGGFDIPSRVVLPYVLYCFAVLFVWLLEGGRAARLRLVLVALGVVGVAGHYGVMWGRVLATSWFNVTPLLCLCVGTIGLGMAAAADLAIRAKRDQQGASRDSSDKSADLEVGRPAVQPPIGWGKRAALQLPAALLIGLLVLPNLPWPAPPPTPARQVTAEAPETLHRRGAGMNGS